MFSVRSEPFASLLGWGRRLSQNVVSSRLFVVSIVALLSEPRPPSQPLKGLRFRRPSARPLRCGGVSSSRIFRVFRIISSIGRVVGLRIRLFKASEERGFLFIPTVAECGEPRPPSQPLKGLRQGRPSARPMVAVVFYSGASPCSPRFVWEPPCGEGERIALALHASRRRASPSPTRRLYFPAHPPSEQKKGHLSEAKRVY